MSPDLTQALAANLLSPAVLFFVLGLGAALIGLGYAYRRFGFQGKQYE